MTLPTGASEASQKRYELALRLVQTCPPELGQEVALTGSTSSGLADDESDLEMNLWGEAIPPAAARVAWLETAGVENIMVFPEPRPDESYWIGGRLGDVPLEMGWQTFTGGEASIEKLLSGGADQTMAYVLLNAIPFRTQGRVARWQERLRVYSDVVQEQAVQKAVSLWSKPERFAAMRRLARRGERLAHIEFILADLHALMALHYAVNRRWMPSRKWTLTAARDLPHVPPHWRERIDAVLTAPPEESIRLSAQLALDALALAPLDYDVSAAVKLLRETLDKAT
jgi:hypothetical protein